MQSRQGLYSFKSAVKHIVCVHLTMCRLFQNWVPGTQPHFLFSHKHLLSWFCVNKAEAFIGDRYRTWADIILPCHECTVTQAGIAKRFGLLRLSKGHMSSRWAEDRMKRAVGAGSQDPGGQSSIHLEEVGTPLTGGSGRRHLRKSPSSWLWVLALEMEP